MPNHHVRENSKVCLQKVKMIYFDKLQFCKITLYTEHFALFRKFAKLDYWLG